MTTQTRRADVVFWVGIAVPAFMVLLLPNLDVNPTLVGTLSLLELVWVLVNGFGAAYALYNFTQSRADYATVRTEHDADPIDLIVARRDRRSDGIILFKQTAYLVIGLLAAFTPPPVVRQVEDLAYVATLLVFIVGSLLLTVLSYSTSIDRRHVQRVIVQRRMLDAMSMSGVGVEAERRRSYTELAESPQDASQTGDVTQHTSEGENGPPEPSGGLHGQDTVDLSHVERTET